MRYPDLGFGRFHGAVHNTTQYAKAMKHIAKVGATIQDCSEGDVRTSSVYVNSADLDDITQILKLKYKELILYCLVYWSLKIPKSDKYKYEHQ